MNTPNNRKPGAPLAVGGRHETDTPAMPGEATPEVVAPRSKQDRRRAIVDAIDSHLDEGNSGHFTDAGVPQIAALEAVLGWRPSTEDRDAAWASRPAR